MNLLYKAFLLSFLLWIKLPFPILAQFGKSGVQTISSNNTILNQYTTLQTNANAGSNTVVVFNITELNNPNPLERGDLLLIIQMQGANINNSNSVQYGEVSNYNGAGNYEFVYVTSIAGNSITLSCPLQNNYSTAGRTQIVRVPQYQKLTIVSTGSLTAPAWNGSRGGIIAIYADTLQLDGQINTSALGFRGGALDNSAANNQINYRSTAANAGAEKGESIAGFQTEYTALGGRFGRGAPANGGGGGNGNNGGGGGGANGGNLSAWFRGAGVMCNTCAGSAAWALDPDFIANANSLTNSAGGGRGGYTTSTSNQNALTLAPGSAAWASDNRRPHGGLGGRPLESNPENRIFFGGGGGAGDQNNNAGGRGGNGGGIVLISSQRIFGNGSIQANGENGESTRNTHNDGAGGGGGGGTIIVKAENEVESITLQARGGNGGNQLITTNQAQGPGGGGGGGVIAVLSPNDNSLKNVSGGTNGTTSSNALTEFPANGATSGNAGSLLGGIPNFILSCNQPPILQNDFATTNEDTPISGNLATNDSDLESLSLIYQAGTFSTAQGGSISISLHGSFTYVPANNFNGNDTFLYTACDNGKPTNQCTTATLAIQVLPINDPPNAQNDNFILDEDATLIGDVSLNDDDGDPELNQTLTFSLLNGGTAVANGTLTFNANGTFTYTPNPNFNGNVSFTYQVCDNGVPVLCATATAFITINPVNDPPNAQNDHFTMNEDATLNGNVATNDDEGDPELNQTLAFSLLDGGTATLNGTLIFNANGTFIYTPNPNFNGNVSFTYQVCDDGVPVLCATATAFITINPINDPPFAQDDTFTMSAATTLNGNVALNDSDVDNLPAELTFTLLNGASAVANGNLLFNNNGTFVYTPFPNFVGVVSFSYQVCDPANACSQAFVTIYITGQSPTAQNAAFTIQEDTRLTASLTDKVADASTPINQLRFSVSHIGTANQNGLLSFLPNGSFTFVPKENFNGVITFEYKVCNLQNLCSHNAQVQIVVEPVNDAPTAQDNEFSTRQSQALTGSVAINDFDVDGDKLTYQAGTFTTQGQGVLKLEANGDFTYTPAYGFVGKDCWEYSVCDPAGACSKARLCVVVENSPDIFIPEAFSPNGDGLYDNFVIEGVADKKITLKVFNRWGNLVFQSTDYQNNWNGIGNEGLHKGENLPDGTYFYTIDLGDGSKPRSNYVVIKR
jgi:gliding motility-associated-like protein